MKTKLLSIWVALLMVATVSFTAGCGSTAQQRTYQGVSVTVVTADAAMTAWGNYVAQFHPPAADEAKVKQAFDRYRAMMIVVVDAGKAYALGSGSTEGVNAAIATAAASLGDLVTLIESFGVKLPQGK